MQRRSSVLRSDQYVTEVSTEFMEKVVRARRRSSLSSLRRPSRDFGTLSRHVLFNEDPFIFDENDSFDHEKVMNLEPSKSGISSLAVQTTPCPKVHISLEKRFKNKRIMTPEKENFLMAVVELRQRSHGDTFWGIDLSGRILAREIAHMTISDTESHILRQEVSRELKEKSIQEERAKSARETARARLKYLEYFEQEANMLDDVLSYHWEKKNLSIHNNKSSDQHIHQRPRFLVGRPGASPTATRQILPPKPKVKAKATEEVHLYLHPKSVKIPSQAKAIETVLEDILNPTTLDSFSEYDTSISPFSPSKTLKSHNHQYWPHISLCDISIAPQKSHLSQKDIFTYLLYQSRQYEEQKKFNRKTRISPHGGNTMPLDWLIANARILLTKIKSSGASSKHTRLFAALHLHKPLRHAVLRQLQVSRLNFSDFQHLNQLVHRLLDESYFPHDLAIQINALAAG